MRRWVLGCALLGLVGCGDGSLIWDPPEEPTETGAAQLRRFQSDNELVSYFRQEASRTERFSGDVALEDSSDDASGGAGAGAPPGAEGPAADGGLQGDADADGLGHSGTTIQEEGVDEPDVVKTDGSHLYILDSGLLRIVSVGDAQVAEVSRVELEGGGQDMFLIGDTVVALTQEWSWFYPDVLFLADGSASGGGSAGAAEGDDAVAPTGPSVIATVIDVADRAAPRVLSTTRFEGNLVSARMIGRRMHLALAIYPHDLGEVFPVGGSRMKSLTLKAADVLPNFECTDASGETITGELLTYDRVFRPADPDGYGMVSVISLDVDAPAQFHAIGVMANPGLTYASLDAFYLTDTQWTFWGDERQTTDIYKFAYTETGVELAGVGVVDGRVLNSYSLGEHEGRLRVATTTSTFDENGFSSGNHVYVLAQNGEALEVVGKLENLAPGETIQSARFIGDRGYLVTFEQVDPLFTLDLSDPADPKVVGELKVPGFSTFIVPMDEHHLLTVGQHIPDDGSWMWGVQLSIFDVTDFAAPQLKHQAVLADGAWSEALYNPKAFTYFAEGGVVALPVTIPTIVAFDEDVMIEDDGSGFPPMWDAPMYRDEFQGVVVYRVSSESGFAEALRLDTRQGDDLWTWWPSFTRGVFIGTQVYAVTNAGVVSASLDAPEEPGPSMKFEQPESTEDADHWFWHMMR